MSDKTTLVLIDDHALFRQGLASLINQNPPYQVIGMAASAQEGIEMVAALQPNLVLLDLDMPNVNGIQALALLRQQHPNLPILMLTISEHPTALQKCLALGANGYLVKNIETQFLMQAIAQTLQGQRVLSPELEHKNTAQNQIENNPAELLNSLSVRENDVLQLIAQGISNKMIAHELALSENTVKVHVQNILRKLKLNSRTQAALFATEHGMA